MKESVMQERLDRVARIVREAERIAANAAGKEESERERAAEVRGRAEQRKHTAEVFDRAGSVLNAYGEEKAAEVVGAIERVVSEGLSAVFGEQMQFAVTSSRRGKTNTTELTLKTTMPDGSVLETDLLSARGGGVAAVAGFLLRLTVLLLTEGARRTIVLDETFAQLSAEYEPAMAAFLRELADRTGTQVLMVTHSDAFSEMADAVYRVGQSEGATSIVREK